jgi:hypothetical protein
MESPTAVEEDVLEGESLHEEAIQQRRLLDFPTGAYSSKDLVVSECLDIQACSTRNEPVAMRSCG